MKSLYIFTPSLGSGGAERVMSILSSTFADTFDKVTIFVWKITPVFYSFDPRVEIIWIPKMIKHQDILSKMLWVREYVKKNPPTIVLSFLVAYNMMTLASLYGMNIPIIVAERSDPNLLRKSRKLLRKIIYRTADGILCQTDSMKDYFRGYLNKKCEVIYNPFFIDKQFIGMALKSQKDKVLVSVGRLVPSKNHKLLIDSFKLFKISHPQYKLRIYGEGYFKDELTNYINEHGMSDHVTFMGNSKDIMNDIKVADAFILTSSNEGMPNALIEAMAIGLPCISTKVCGAVDLIKDGENGYLVDYDPNEISVAISKVIDNPEMARRLATNATSIAEDLKAEKINQQWISYLSKFISKQ